MPTVPLIHFFPLTSLYTIINSYRCKICSYVQSQVELCFSLLVISRTVPHAAVVVLLPLRDKLLLQVWPLQVVSEVPSTAARERENNHNNLCQLFKSRVYSR